MVQLPEPFNRAVAIVCPVPGQSLVPSDGLVDPRLQGGILDRLSDGLGRSTRLPEFCEYRREAGLVGQLLSRT
ncbi:hypothetical protein GS924_25040 [Rhodococcus hoagii]|nr:hypothetical protein [Prescottella equi]